MTPDPFVLLLSRLQFGLTIGFHYIFVPLTLGLAVTVAVMDTLRVTTGRHEWRRAARFWNRFFVLAWCIGMVTGYPMRMQLQGQWSGYTEYAREVLHTIMGLEGVILPIMVVMIVGLAFSAHHLPPKWRAGARWFLAVILLVQATCIVTLNAWMQHPVGTRLDPMSAHVVSLNVIFLSSTALCKVAHTLCAGLLTGTMFVVAVSAYYLVANRELPVARFSMALALPMAGLALTLTILTGHASAHDVMQKQPMKFAAMEAHWQQEDGPAALTLIALPDSQLQVNRFAISVPKLMSWLATQSNASPRGIRELTAEAEIKLQNALNHPDAADMAGWRQLYSRVAQQDPNWSQLSDQQRIHRAALESRPHVETLFWSFRLMIGSAVVLGLVILLALTTRRRLLLKGGLRTELRLLMICLPLPWVATFAGWTLAEAGRQPWVIYEQMTTASAAPSLPTSWAAVGQLSVFIVAYAALGWIFYHAARWLLLRGPMRHVWPTKWRRLSVVSSSAALAKRVLPTRSWMRPLKRSTID